MSSQLENLLQIVNPLVQQVQALSRRQDELERAPAPMQERFTQPASTPVRKAPGLSSVSALLGSPTAPISALAKNLGPPPRTKALAQPVHEEKNSLIEGDEPYHDGLRAPVAGQDESWLGAAVVEQSRALASLMVHLQHGSQDPLPELAGQPSGGLGVTERSCKAFGSGEFYLRLSQAISRRMAPTAPAPRSLKEAASVSMVEYWERYGGYGQSRELGMIQWSLAHVYDTMAREDHGLDHCNGGLGKPGWRQLAASMASRAVGRSSSKPVDQQSFNGYWEPATFQPLGGPELGNGCSGLFERDRDPDQPKERGKLVKAHFGNSSPGWSRAEAKAKKEAMGRKGRPEGSWIGPGRAVSGAAASEGGVLIPGQRGGRDLVVGKPPMRDARL